MGKSKTSKAYEQCGAKLRKKDAHCQQPAGNRTDHPGQGRCWLHGGASPIKHGRYSQVNRARFLDKINRFEADPDPLNLEPEVALLRAFVEDLIERWDEIYGPDGALLAWHESFGKTDEKGNPIISNPKPRQLPDFSAVSSVVDKVGGMVDRIQKHKAEGSVKLTTLNRVMEQMGVDVVQSVGELGLSADQNTKLIESIERRWGNLRLEPERNSGQKPS